MSTYAELLRDPRWQRKRLEVMNRADFRCEKCGADNRTLHVHHKRYRKGAKPWEYEGHELVCLCEDCHRATHAKPNAFSDALDERWPVLAAIACLVHFPESALGLGSDLCTQLASVDDDQARLLSALVDDLRDEAAASTGQLLMRWREREGIEVLTTLAAEQLPSRGCEEIVRILEARIERVIHVKSRFI